MIKLDQQGLESAIRRANEFPYDGYDDDGEIAALQHTGWPETAARAIIGDLSDRRGIKHGFDNIDFEIRQEIVAHLAAIIRYAHDTREQADGE